MGFQADYLEKEKVSDQLIFSKPFQWQFLRADAERLLLDLVAQEAVVEVARDAGVVDGEGLQGSLEVRETSVLGRESHRLHGLQLRASVSELEI